MARRLGQLLSRIIGGGFGGGHRTARKRRGAARSEMLLQNLESRLLMSFTAGHLDPAFNPLNPSGFGKAAGVLANNGYGTAIAEVQAATMLANGKILIAGLTDVSPTQIDSIFGMPLTDALGYPLRQTQLTLVRFNADGTLDNTFGTGGYVNWHTPDALAPDGVTLVKTITRIDNNSLVVQADGKIVVGGAVGLPDSTGIADRTSDFIAVRFNADGTLDDGGGSDSTPGDKFSGNNNSVLTNGYVQTDYAEGYEVGRAVTLQSDGKILLTGYTQVSRLNPQSFFFTVRYNPDGSLDTKFGEYGHALTAIGASSTLDYSTQARTIMLQPDGKILVGGQARMPFSRYDVRNLAQSPWDTSFVVARYNADGSLDTTFGQTTPSDPSLAPAITYPATPGIQWVEATFGWRTVPPPFAFDEGRDFVSAMTMDANNNIYMTGYAYADHFVSSRLTPNGAIDMTWGGNSGLHATINVSVDRATDITVQADGRVIVSGISIMGADGQAENVGMIRYNPDATVDTFFGTNGRVYTNTTGAVADIPLALLPTPDGKFVIVTNTYNTAVDLATYSPFDTGLGSVGITGGPARIGFFRYLNDQISADDVRPLPALRNAANTGRAPDVTVAGGTTYTFSVLLTDNVGISIASLGSAGNKNLLYVTGPNGFSQAVTFNSVDVGTDGQPRLAQFSFDAPGGSWDLTDTGIYTIHLRENAIWDTANNRMPAGPLGQFSVSILPDATRPTALGQAPDVSAAGGTSYTFQVVYSDNVGIDLTTLGSKNVLVTGPNNFSQLATFMGVDQPINGTPRVATYRITPPGGSWSASSQGIYRVFVQPSQVGDTAVIPGLVPVPVPNYVQSGQVAQFTFAIADTTAPTAAMSANNLNVSGGATYNFTVTYSDNQAIDVSTIGTGDVVVTGPGGFSQVATLLGVDVNANGTPRTATYRINAPGGTWGPADSGTYTINIVAGQIADLAGNVVVPGPLGTFQMNLGVDLAPPTVVATANPISNLGFTSEGITLTITDNVAVKASSLQTGNIYITGPNNFVGEATLVSLDQSVDGTTRTAFFTLAAPGGEWSPIHSGTYSIYVRASQIKDVNGNFTPAGLIGTFTVSIPGTLPPGVFGTNGYVSTAVSGASQTIANRVVRLTNGKVLAVGTTTGTTEDIMLVQYNADGSLDTSFGNNGVVITDFGADETGNGVAVQPDGKIVVTGGTSNDLGQGDLVVARYNANGTLDATFGTGGKLVTDFNTGYERGDAVIIQPNGKIVVAGMARLVASSPDSYLFLVRYNANGTLDTTFGAGGRTITDVAGNPPTNQLDSDEEAFTIGQQSDGKIVIAGRAYVAGAQWVLGRYSADGQIDASFGTGGLVLGPNGIARRFVIQPDGKIIVTGSSGAVFTTARYLSNGTLDATWGGTGIVTTNFSIGSSDISYAVALLNDGKVLVSGSTTLANNTDFAQVRYNANGSLDNTFGTSGKRITNFVYNSDDFVRDVIILPAGNVLLAGQTAIKDTTPPAAYLNAPHNIAANQSIYYFQVTYADNELIQATSVLSNNAVYVTGPNGYSQNATFVSATSGVDSNYITVTYSLIGPGANQQWNIVNPTPPLPATSDVGTYVVHVNNNIIQDTAKLFVPGGAIGTFTFDGAIAPIAPAAISDARDVPVLGVSTYTFNVVYFAFNTVTGTPLNVQTLGMGDVRVTGPNGYSQLATYLGVRPVNNSPLVTATYRITAPNGTFGIPDLGTYTVSVAASEVADVAGSYVSAGVVGTFRLLAQGLSNVGLVMFPADGIAFNDSEAPVGTLSAPNVNAAGGTSYTFTVTYSDNVLINGSSINSADVYVLGPKGYNGAATLVSVAPTGNAQSVVATYRITPPGGAWAAGWSGTYTVMVKPNEVFDTSNNFVVAGALGTFTATLGTDGAAPQAMATAPNITTFGGALQTFTVVYTDNVAIDQTTLDNFDILVTGPGGYSQYATFVSVNAPFNGTPRTATYSIVAPGGTWDTGDAGDYFIMMQANQVTDTSGLPVAASKIGGFSVIPPDTTAPQASLAAGDMTVPVSPYTFTITYTDDRGIKISTIGNGDVVVTGPGGYNQPATLVSVDVDTDGTPRSATYSIPGPGGSWDYTDSGSYTVSMATGQVTDTSNNPVAAGALGTFTVAIPVPPPDSTPPIVVSFNAPTVVAAAPSILMTIAYSDNYMLSFASFGNGDITVNGPAGKTYTGVFVSADANADGATRSIVYRITPATGGFNSNHNGTYTILLAANEVTDVSGNAAIAATVGTFNVNIPDTDPPLAVASAPAVTTEVTSVDIVVTYSDPNLVKISTLDSSDIVVVDPQGNARPVTFVGVNTNSNGSPRVATYRLSPLGVNGTYTIRLKANQVSDVPGNAATTDTTIGTFTVNIADVAPVASLPYSDFAGPQGNPQYRFDVIFQDYTGLSLSSLTNANAVTVTFPGGKVYSATYVAGTLAASNNNTRARATYQIVAPNMVWDERAAGAYTVSLKAGQVSDVGGKLSGAQVLGQFHYSPSVFFNERYYLAQYGDVANAIAAKALTSGWQHFKLYGQFEQRNASAFYNDRVYLARNADVAQAVAQKLLPSGWFHYTQWGVTERRTASGYFDSNFYLQKYADVQAALTSGNVKSALEHFLVFGMQEGRDPSPLVSNRTYATMYSDSVSAVMAGLYRSTMEHFFVVSVTGNLDRTATVFFDRTTYLNNNSDIKGAVNAGLMASAYDHFLSNGIYEKRVATTNFNETYYKSTYADIGGAVNSGAFPSGMYHYVFYGQFEKRNPLSTFDENFYLTTYADVKAGVLSGAFTSGYQHYVLHGKAEGRSGKA